MPWFWHHNLLELKWQQSLNESVHTFPLETIGGDLGWGESPAAAFKAPPRAMAGASPPAQALEPGGGLGRRAALLLRCWR